MARNTGIFNFSANLEVKKNAPLDARIVVGTKLELTSTDTWSDADNKVWLYNGIVVSVLENHGLYMLTNYDPVTNPTAYSEEENWVALDASAAKIDIVDNLESTSVTAALSANLGKVLNEKIENVKSSLSSVYSYKGSVDNYSELPTNAVLGDTYNVVNANGNVPAGTNYSWNGTAWDALGGSVDLSDYYTKTEINDKIDEKLTDPSEKIAALETSVNANTTALELLNNTDATKVGSLANTLKVAKDYTDTLLTGYVEKVEGSSLISSEKLALIDTNTSKILNLETLVEANTAALNILNGDAETEGSVLNKINNTITNTLSWEEIN